MGLSVQFYRDKECTVLVEEMSFGRLIAGETKTVPFYIKNTGLTLLEDLRVYVKTNRDIEVNVLEPDIKRLPPQNVQKGVVEIKPKAVDSAGPLMVVFYAEGFITQE